jgi:hypothetical protein
MLIAIAVVLVGIFSVATGRGGELAYEQADHAPLDLGPVSAADIALLRPPSAMWGYNMQVTDAALDQIARAMRERDVTIAYLQDQLASTQRNGSYTEPRGAHARPVGIAPLEPLALEPLALEPFGASDDERFEEEPFDDEAFEEGPFEDEAPEGEAFEGEAPEGEAPEGEAPEERAVPEPLEPLAAAGSHPAEPPAAEALPAEALPAEALPAEALPAEALPAEALPAQTMPAEAPRTADVPVFTPTATYRQTPLVLKASGPKPPPLPESRGATTQPSEIHAPTEPNAVLKPGTPGPQGTFDTHDWWAEQTEAAREERARRQAAGETDEEESGRPADDPLAAEEEGW